MRQWRLVLGIVGITCCGLVAAGCERAPSDQAPRWTGIAPDVAAQLADPGQPAFATFTATTSTDRLIALRQPLLELLYGVTPLPAGEQAKIAAVLAGLEQELAAGRGLVTYSRESALLASLPDTTVRRLVASRRDIGEVFRDTGRPVTERIARIEQLQARLLDAGDGYGALPAWGLLAVLEHRRHDLATASRHQRRAYEQARELGRLAEAGRAWGQLMMARMADGLTDAERDTLHELTVQTRAARLAAVTSHLLCLHGYDEYKRGRNAAARAAFEDGIDICRGFGEPAAAVATMVILLRKYATLECWGQVATLLGRANRLLDEATAGREPTVNERLQRTQLDNLAARRLAALGHADPAAALFAQTFVAASVLPHAEVGFVGRQWFEAMMDADRPDLAAVALSVLTPATAAGDLPTLAWRIPFWQAWLSWRTDDHAAARRHLEQFESEGLQTAPAAVAGLEHQYLALKARVLWPTAPQAAAATLLHGWRALQERLLANEPGSEAYLDLSRNPHLRWAAQDLLADSPLLGYGLELLWRDVMLRRARSLASLGCLVEGARALATAAQQGLAEADALHCVYRLRPDGVVRWTANGRQVEQARLTISTEQLRERVSELLQHLAEDPGDPDAPIPAALRAELTDLARLLLPGRMFAARTRPARLFISGEGVLNLIPFATLNVGPHGDYQPLVATVDLAWVRHGPGARMQAANDRVLVVADPALDAGTRRRYGLADGLVGARNELASIRERLPAVEVLQGSAATAERVRARWDGVAVLYFVGHAITDPLAPFFVWLPLSGDENRSGHPGLGVQDILAHRFDGCAAVFLSGCATGAPFVDGLATAPSLGDAFLDAGAQAAVQTFWVVRDLDSPVRPERMLATWRDGRSDLVGAVSQELRAAMHGPRGIRHPFTWAAWAVNVGGW
jgi:hypothetical protein